MKSKLVSLTAGFLEFISSLYVAFYTMKLLGFPQFSSVEFTLKPLVYLLIGLSLDKLNKDKE